MQNIHVHKYLYYKNTVGLHTLGYTKGQGDVHGSFTRAK